MLIVCSCLLIVCCCLLVGGCWLLTAGCWLLVGCWLLAAGSTGCWLLAIGCRLAGCLSGFNFSQLQCPSIVNGSQVLLAAVALAVCWQAACLALIFPNCNALQLQCFPIAFCSYFILPFKIKLQCALFSQRSSLWRAHKLMQAIAKRMVNESLCFRAYGGCNLAVRAMLQISEQLAWPLLFHSLTVPCKFQKCD